MRFVAIALAAATFVGASCPNPAPLPPPDVVVDAAVDEAPAPVVDASLDMPDATTLSDASTSDAAPPVADSTPPAPTPPPKPSCQTACDAVRKVGCKEGNISNCAAKLCQINADPRFKHYDVACLSSATTPKLVRACGVDCTL